MKETKVLDYISDKDSMIDYMQVFGWECINVQKTDQTQSHVSSAKITPIYHYGNYDVPRGYDVSVNNTTTHIEYFTLTFQRDTGIANYQRIRQLEQGCSECLDNMETARKAKKRWKISAIIMMGLSALMLYGSITGNKGLDILWGILIAAAGFGLGALCIWRMTKKTKYIQQQDDEGRQLYQEALSLTQE